MSQTYRTDHDRIFKELLSVFFLDFLELFFPEVVKFIEPGTLELLDKEVFTDVTAGERHEVDLLVKVKFRGKDTYFLIHVENQSSNDTEIAERMFRYFARLIEKYGMAVYPIVLFSYEKPYRAEKTSYKVEFENKVVLEFNYDVIQLNRLNWRDYLKTNNPIASALMARMKIAPKDRPLVKLECLRLLATLKLDRARTQLISGFIDTYLKLNLNEQQLLQQQLSIISPNEQEAVMEIVTSWMEQGLQRGLQQGLEQGLEQGKKREITLVLRQIKKRFGSIAVETQTEIEQLPIEKLEDFGEALLDFSQQADLINWLTQNKTN